MFWFHSTWNTLVAKLCRALYDLPRSLFSPLHAQVMLMRLQGSPTVKFKRALIRSMSLFVHQHGYAMLEQVLNQIQPGMIDQLLTNVWLPEVSSRCSAVNLGCFSPLSEPTTERVGRKRTIKTTMDQRLLKRKHATPRHTTDRYTLTVRYETSISQ